MRKVQRVRLIGAMLHSADVALNVLERLLEDESRGHFVAMAGRLRLLEARMALLRDNTQHLVLDEWDGLRRGRKRRMVKHDS